jgi:16S rRNA (cytosine967-C5)-methyltransferase
MIHQSHYNTAITILQGYNGSLPFHHYIKQFFNTHKKYGSKDRKQITNLCYQYFRLGHALPNLGVKEKILMGAFLCQQQPSPLLAYLRPDLNDLIHIPIKEKLEWLQLQPNDIFPFRDALGPTVDAQAFTLSLLVQPLLFLRFRPGKEQKVTQKLTAAGIAFTIVDASCIALPNAAKVDAVLKLNEEAVVQDASSQQVGDFFMQYQPAVATGQYPAVWDCCAASGGKSIMLHDVVKGRCQLTVTDIRSSILQNLSQRFQQAGILRYNSFVADLSAAAPGNHAYDAIICDAPCSGSGTWARTPEQLCFFNPQKIAEYAQLQRQIITNATPQLKPGGIFYYITCSVFTQENEDNVAFMQKQGLELLQQQLIQGWDRQADSMFVAVLKRCGGLADITQ